MNSVDFTPMVPKTESQEERLQRVIAVHFHPELGTPLLA